MRLKIIAGNLAAVLLIGLVSYFLTTSKISDTLASHISTEVENDGTLFERSFRLSGIEFLNDTVDRASTRELRAGFNAIEPRDQRQRAFDQAEAIAQWFRDPSRRGTPPDIVAVTDETGKVVARDKDINRMVGDSLIQTVPSLRDVLHDGRARNDAWFKEDENKLLQTAIAAVRNEQGAIIGALIVGYDLSNLVAEGEAQMLGRDVAFLVEGKIYSHSTAIGEIAEPLRTELFETQQATTEAAFAGTRSSPWTARLGDDEYVGVTAPLPLTPSAPVAYVVLANRTEALSLSGEVGLMLIVLGVLGVVAVFAYGFVISGLFLRPLERIEDSLLAIINGRTDIRIDVESAEFGGLAYRINQLINVFTGVAEEDEEGRMTSQAPAVAGGGAAPAWQGSAFDTATPEGGGGGGGDVIDDPAVAQQLAAEPEDAYYARIYREYVAAKQAAGEDVSNIPQERFVKRLQANAAALTKKHGCRAVRFAVQAQGNQVALRPVIIR